MHIIITKNKNQKIKQNFIQVGCILGPNWPKMGQKRFVRSINNKGFIFSDVHVVYPTYTLK